MIGVPETDDLEVEAPSLDEAKKVIAEDRTQRGRGFIEGLQKLQNEFKCDLTIEIKVRD